MRLTMILLAVLAVAVMARPIGESTTTIADPLDASGNALLVEELARCGDMFVGYAEFTGVADSDSFEVVIDPTVGSQWGFAVFADKPVIVELMEEFAYSDSGTAIDLYDLDRDSDESAGSDISHTPTDTAAGTSIFGVYVPASTNYVSELFGTTTPFTLDTLAADSIDYCLDIENNGSGNMAGYVCVFAIE